FAKIVIDLLIAVGAVLAAILLRFDGSLPADVPVLLAVVMSLCLKTIPYLVAGLHRRSWSNLTFRDLGGLVALGAFVAFVGTLLLVIFGAQLGIPRSIAVLDS